MRLTLRTLLAYMDGILDPADQEDLAKQIAASDDASDLIHRTRDTMRRMKLEAPPLEGADFDANAVAEYLDNTAAPQAVMDFEIESLKSDSYLAEVASCHHILTMVLGERAEIDPETRRRMYAIPEVAEALAAGAAPAVKDSAARITAPETVVTEVPDYLREGRRSPLARWLPAVAALLLLGGVSYLAFSPGGWLRPIDPADPIQAAFNDPAVPTLPALGEETEGESEAGGQETPDAAGESTEPGADNGTPSLDLNGDAGTAPGMTIDDPIPPVTDNTATDNTATDTAASDTTAIGTATGQPGVTVESPSTNALPEETTPAEPSVPMPEETTPTEPDPLPVVENPDPIPSPDAEEQPAAPTDDGGDAAASEPSPVGLLSSPQEVLLRYVVEDGSWQRLPVRTAVMTGDVMLSLPTFHPTMTLDSGLSVEMVDGTQVEIGRAEASDTPRLQLAFGKLILTNTGGQPTRLRLQVGQVEAELEIAARSAAAVEAGRPFVVGSDPILEQAPLSATFYAPTGGVTLASDQGTLTATEPGQWRLAGDSLGPVEPMDEKVGWLNGRELSAWESEATDEVEAQIVVQQPVWPQLMEIFGSRLKEQRALAAASSAYVEHFDPFIRALGEEDFRPAWDDVVGTLRESMARSPASAAEVRRTLLELHGPERTADLYKMLCGYSAEEIGAGPDEWPTGAMRQLVEWLRSPHTEYRVLANHNLQQITGRRGVFNPVGTPLTRERDVRKYESRLQKGDLRPRTAS